VFFNVGKEKRTIELYINVVKGIIEPRRFFINGENVSRWSIDKYVIGEGEKAKAILEYRWDMDKFYVIDMITADGQRASTGRVLSPKIEPDLTLKIRNITLTSNLNWSKIYVDYEVDASGIDLVDIFLFTYSSFEKKNRSVMIFFDSDYMSEIALRRAKIIIDYFSGYNVTLQKIRFNDLENIKNVEKAILILVNPLKDKLGRKIENAMPSPLIDPDNDGFINKYNKSILYRLMKDNGLIFVTVGSLQPHKRILYSNGTYIYPSDSFKPFDIHEFFTDASGDESIIKGNFMIGSYTGVRISGTLGIEGREASFGFDKEALERYNLKYYAYGDYTLHFDGKKMTLILPVFIRVGEGGLLFVGDEEYWLTDEQIARELFFIYLQSIWDSVWIPYGWYWDSGSDHYICAGKLRINERVETEQFPTYLINKQVLIRVVAVAYSNDLKKGGISEEEIVYYVP
jgi:hypothetical protein